MDLPKVCWLSSFEIGVPAIDDEHRAIVDLLAGIVARIASGALDQVAVACDALHAAAVRHWANEERQLEVAEFPRLDEHRAIHRGLDQMMRGLRTRCGGTCDTDLAKDCVRNWFSAVVEHIVRHDTAFGAHLLRR